MRGPLPELFICPRCGRGPLVQERAQAGAGESTFACGGCGACYPVRGGIPRFVPRENYADSFGFQWNQFRRTQLDSHTGLPVSRKRLFGVTRWPGDLTGERVLEAGSGAGRFTEILVGTGARVFSFDYSTAVEANFANNGAAPNLCLFQGDIFHIPLYPGSFDKVLCLGVLQHTPDPPRAFASLAAQLKPGGRIVVDVYRRGLSPLLLWKYLLRPVTKRMEPQRLYHVVEKSVDALLPLAISLRRVAGRAGSRLLPIIEYSNLGLPDALNREWAVLDTFDMYSPAHDHPQSHAAVRRWFNDAGLVDVEVFDAANGIVARGALPAAGR